MKSPLDRETTPQYVLKVVATDSGTVDAVRSATHTLTVTVTDDNDNAPVFSPCCFVAVSESTTVGATVATVTADVDSAAAGLLSYGIVAGNNGNVLRVEKLVTTGVAEVGKTMTLRTSSREKATRLLSSCKVTRVKCQ